MFSFKICHTYSLDKINKYSSAADFPLHTVYGPHGTFVLAVGLIKPIEFFLIKDIFFCTFQFYAHMKSLNLLHMNWRFKIVC